MRRDACVVTLDKSPGPEIDIVADASTLPFGGESVDGILSTGALEHMRDPRKAIAEMHRQVGDLELDERGLAVRGVLLRHLVMPGLLDETEAILRWIAGIGVPTPTPSPTPEATPTPTPAPPVLGALASPTPSPAPLGGCPPIGSP